MQGQRWTEFTHPMETQNGEEDSRCNRCGMTLTAAANLAMHKKTFVNTKPGECPYCLVVQSKSDLSRHIKRCPKRNSRKVNEMEKRGGSAEEEKKIDEEGAENKTREESLVPLRYLGGEC